MIKTCIKCNSSYEAPGRVRNRPGLCNPCKLQNKRLKYIKTQDKNGIPVFQFERLLAIGLKKCTSCFEIKDVSLFSLRSAGTKYRTSCKKCDSEAYKKYEKLNKEKINSNRRKRRKDPEYGIIFTQRDRQRSLFKNKNRYKPQSTTKLIREWLGCDLEQCKLHIQSLFSIGMTWDNRGVGHNMWQIDHKIPVSLTMLSEDGNMIDNDFNRSIWHYTNLQPLWHSDNAKKSNKYYGGLNINKQVTVTAP